MILGTLLLLVASLASAQTTTGYIVGIVKDATGSVIPGVNLTLTELGTGATRSAVSDADGSYSFRQLNPGEYRLTAEQPSFKRFIQEPISVRVNEATRVDAMLQLGDISEQVLVQGTGIQVQTTNSTLGAVVEEKKVVDLPLNGRNFVQLGLLQAGVSEGGPSQTAVGSTASTFAVNGVRTQNNNFMIDGVMAGSVENNSLDYRPNPDTIKEFKIQTNTYSAEFGRTPGGVINIVTKSGTNQFHGTAWEFFRNEVLDARNFFARSVPVNKRNQYGVSFGGPVAKDRTFFFAAYEGFKLRRGTARNTIVPTPAEKAGDFSALTKAIIDPLTGSQFTGNRIPDNRIDPAAKLLVKLYPDANIAGAGVRANNFSSAPGVPTDQFNVMGRLDHKLSSKDDFSARYFIDSVNSRTAFQGPSNLPTFYQENTGYRQHVVLNYTRVFSPTLVNDFRIGFARTTTTGVYYPIVPAKQYGINLDTPDGVGLPAFEITGMAGLGNVIQGPSAFAFNTFQYLDTVSWTKGRHQLSMGGEFRKTQENVTFRFTHNGSYQMTGGISGDAFADFMLGLPQTFTLGTGRPFLAQRNTSFSVFLQDDWKVTRKLTLNLGVRYDLYTPIHDIRKETSALFIEKMATPGVPQSGGLIIDAPGTQGLSGEYDVYFADKNDIVPRIGFSYDVFGNGRLAVRGGFGIFVSQEIGNLQLQQLISYPYTNYIVLNSATTSDPLKGVDTSVPIKFPYRGITSQALNTDPYIRHPYYNQYNLNIQFDLGGGWFTEVGYVGSQGKKLLHFQEINQPITTPDATRTNKDSRRPYKDFSTVILSTDFGASNYNAFQLSVKRRFSGGFTMDSAYTFSKSLDLGSQFHAGGQNRYEGVLTQDDNCRNCDRGVSGFDTPHRWVTSFLYELPVGRGKRFLASSPGVVDKLLGGWQVNAILLFKNGWPFTVRDFRDRSLAAGAFIPVDRPNLVGKETVTGDPNKWFDVSAYSAVPLGTFGNLGRNTLRGDGVSNLDLSVFKRTYIPKISEQFAVEFRAEFFNLPNHATFNFPNNDFGSSTPGRVGSTVLDERQIQFALKVIF